ncbi:MAG: peptidase S41 [Proteobacteria bacterium]|nr:peptidase S41 [Pseudomonadota bacterium]
MKTAVRPLSVALVCAALAACGGGSDSHHTIDSTGTSGNAELTHESSSSGTTPDSGGPSIAMANQCARPRTGTDPSTGKPYPDTAGTLETEKSWVRAWIDETYLWFNEVPTTLKASDYATPQAYFDVLKTPLKTASGADKDRFHYFVDTASFQGDTAGTGSVGYGMEVALISSVPPRVVRVAFVTPGTPAAVNSIDRGDTLVTLDGVDVANGSADALNAALFPTNAGEAHTMVVTSNAGVTRTVTLTSAVVVPQPVMNVSTIATTNGLVGYLQFNQHNEVAETELADAINKLKALSVTELVLDMRYNGGGLLGVASELAYMVAGPGPTQGKTFERMVTNSKNPYGFTDAEANFPFQATAVGYSLPADQALPNLGLSKVTVLSGPDTCSASESVVNGLRGVGVKVDLVGSTTCGKPYGFFPVDNCGTTYLAINFQGVNAQGFGDYGDGMAPTCSVADDFNHDLGDRNEARLAAALTLSATGACPAPTGSSAGQGLRKSTGPLLESPYLRPNPLRDNKRIDGLLRSSARL